MCEILYSLRDPGDVVTVKPDGFAWTKNLATHVIKLPKLSVAEGRLFKEYDFSMEVQADLEDDLNLQKEGIKIGDIDKVQVVKANLSSQDLANIDGKYTVMTRLQRESEMEKVKLKAVAGAKTIEVGQKTFPVWYGTGKRFKVDTEAKTIIDKVTEEAVYTEPE